MLFLYPVRFSLSFVGRAV
uniref:Uncharacterized protein n=1 Tax=Anguilla anguilla TaxID=7936 RepID=A0A0E9XB90_ANGAN